MGLRGDRSQAYGKSKLISPENKIIKTKSAYRQHRVQTKSVVVIRI